MRRPSPCQPPGHPVGERGKGFGAEPTAPTLATDGAPDGFSWPGRAVEPAQYSPCLEGLEEQAGGMPVVCRRLDGSRHEPDGAQQWDGAHSDSLQEAVESMVVDGAPHQPRVLLDGSCGRDGSSSSADGAQHWEAWQTPDGSQNEGSIALIGLRWDAPSRHGYQRGKLPSLNDPRAQLAALSAFDADVLAASSSKSEAAHRNTLERMPRQWGFDLVPLTRVAK